MPVLGIPDNEIEDVFVLRQNDDGGVPDLCLDIDELIDGPGTASMRSIGPWAPAAGRGASAHGKRDRNHNARPQDPQDSLKAMH